MHRRGDSLDLVRSLARHRAESPEEMEHEVALAEVALHEADEAIAECDALIEERDEDIERDTNDSTRPVEGEETR